MVPSTIKGVVQVQCGIEHCLALTREGTVLAWGANGYGQTNVPADLGKCTAVRASRWSSAARKEDGTWRAWGYEAGGVIAKINSLGKAIDLSFYVADYSGKGTGCVVWIEPID